MTVDHRFQHLLTTLGIGALWVVLWPAIGMAIMLALTIALGPNTDIGPIEMAVILGRLGLVAGLAFGAIVAVAEPWRTMSDVSPGRALTYAVAAAAITGVVAGLQPSAIVNACVLGGASGLATIAITRAFGARRFLRS